MGQFMAVLWLCTVNGFLSIYKVNLIISYSVFRVVQGGWPHHTYLHRSVMRHIISYYAPPPQPLITSSYKAVKSTRSCLSGFGSYTIFRIFLEVNLHQKFRNVLESWDFVLRYCRTRMHRAVHGQGRTVSSTAVWKRS